MAAISTVIFDLAGTLVDDWPEEAHIENMREMASVLSISHKMLLETWLTESLMDVKVQRPTIHDHLTYVCQLLGHTISHSKIEEATQLRATFMKEQFLIPRPDSVATLTTLRKMGYQTGLISNTSVEVPLLWPETSFAQLMDTLIFSCSVGYAKPDEQIYQMALQNLAVLPEECLYVGDGGSLELTGAKRVGMYPVLIRTPDAHTWILDWSREDAKHWDGPTIATLAELLGLLGELAP